MRRHSPLPNPFSGPGDDQGQCCKRFEGRSDSLGVHGRERPALFKGRHFAPEIIILCVRRYLRYALSLRNLEEIMAERNVEVDHVTIWRWIQYYAPELSRRCRPELRKTNGSWRVDETYLRVAGKWTYLYRAVDSTGDTIDFLLSPTRDAGAAKRFFQRAFTVSKPSTAARRQRRPESRLSESYRGAQSLLGNSADVAAVDPFGISIM